MTGHALATATFTFPAEVGTAAAARRALGEAVRLDPIRLAEAQLLVSELITNALQHGSLVGPEALEMTVDSDPTRVRITVGHDSPPGVDVSAQGIGLTLVEHLARRWGCDSAEDRFAVWFEMRPAGTGEGLTDLTDDDLLLRAREDGSYVDEVVRRYRGLAESLAVRFRGRGVADGDLEQVALVGLLGAVGRYDPEIGPFKPYAILTIQGSLKRHLRDLGWSVRVPRSLQERSLLVAGAAESLTQALGRTATPEDVARELEMAVEDVREAAAAGTAYQWESIDAPVAASGASLADSLAEVGSLDVDEWHALVLGMSSLGARERELLRLRFSCDLTQQEIADLMGISQMHVSRLLSKTLGRLRRFLEDESSAE